MSEGITSYDGLVGLHGHIHQSAYHTRSRYNLGSIDIGINVDTLVTLQDHSYFLQGSVAGTLADTVDCHLHLSCTIQHTL